MVSRRIAKFGLKLCEGDLVLDDLNEPTAEILDDDVVCDDDENDDNAEPNEENDQPATVALSTFKAMVKPLTKQDIDSNKYSIFDIVLPLPGHDITYPANECAQWYEERLEKDGLSSEKLKQKQK